MAYRTLTVAAIQSAFGHDMKANIAKTESLIREAARRGAQIVLPPELFQGIYFPTQQDPKWFETAYPADAHPCVLALRTLAKALRVVIPISFFEKDGPRYYNSVAVADAEIGHEVRVATAPAKATALVFVVAPVLALVGRRNELGGLVANPSQRGAVVLGIVLFVLGLAAVIAMLVRSR